MNESVVRFFLAHVRVFNLIFQLGYFSLVGALFLTRRVVLRVFRKVSVAAGFRNSFYNFRTFGFDKIVKLFLQIVQILLRHYKTF